MKLKKGTKCIYCYWYRPKENERCWGLKAFGIEECIKKGYSLFVSRTRVNAVAKQHRKDTEHTVFKELKDENNS